MILAPRGPGNRVHGRVIRYFCRRLNLVAERAHRQRDSRPCARSNNCREAGEVVARCARRAALDLAAPQGRVRTQPASPRQHGPVSDAPRTGYTKFDPLPNFVETCTATLLNSKTYSRKHGMHEMRGMPFCSDMRRRSEFTNNVTRRYVVQSGKRARTSVTRFW